MDTPETLYKEGFNNGYLLAQYEPSLLEKLLGHLEPSGHYLEGMFSGKEEFQLEYTRSQTEALSRLRDHSQDQDRGIDLS